MKHQVIIGSHLSLPLYLMQRLSALKKLAMDMDFDFGAFEKESERVIPQAEKVIDDAEGTYGLPTPNETPNTSPNPNIHQGMCS